MHFFNKVLPTYNFHYFDSYHQLQTKKLNIFLSLMRKIFSFYPETHLSTVVKKAYQISLQESYSFNPTKKEKILKLIEKVNNTKRYPDTYFSLPQENLPEGMKISMRYEVQKKGNSYSLASIDFKINFFKGLFPATYGLSIFKNRSNRFVASLPSKLFRGGGEDTKEIIQERLSSEKVKVINQFVKKIIQDSQIPPLHFYATNYHVLKYNFHQDNPASLDRDSLRDTQKTSLEDLGWTFEEFYRAKSFIWDAPVFSLKKENVKISSDFKQNLSLDFAIPFLTPSSEEYLSITS